MIVPNQPCPIHTVGHGWDCRLLGLLGWVFCCACALRCQCQYAFENVAAARERKVLKRYSDEIFSTGLLSRKKTRTKTSDRKLYPVVVKAVEKVAKWVKTHYVGYSEQRNKETVFWPKGRPSHSCRSSSRSGCIWWRACVSREVKERTGKDCLQS